jgi:hypothetical protein
MTSRRKDSREVAQQPRSYYDRRDELIKILLAHYYPSKHPKGCISSKSPPPSTLEADESTSAASPSREVEMQAVPTDPAGTREDGHNEA